jgi:CDP-L-myo-inositol myo-inositolphosphotransferase
VAPLVVLLPGHDVRVLGMSVRQRNARVAARRGASIVEAAELATHGARLAVVVPPQVVVHSELFDAVAEHRATSNSARRPESPFWLGRVLVGPASEVAVYAADLRGGGQRAHALTRRQAPAAAAAGVASAAERRRAARDILRRTGKPTDGWVSRHLNRPISRRVSHVLLRCGLGAPHASAITLAAALAAAAIGARPGYWPLLMTGLLFHIASILDGVDGEMARATLTESAAGARLDTIVDQLTYAVFFAGITVGWAREAGGIAPLAWSAGIAGVLALSLWRAGRFVARYAPDGSFVFVDRSVRRAARDSGRACLRVVASLFTLLRRDLFAVVFLFVAATGVRAAIPALVLIGVLLANGTFSLYRRELAEAAIAERAAG